MIEDKRTREISILESKDGIKFEENNILTESVGWGKFFHQTVKKF